MAELSKRYENKKFLTNEISNAFKVLIEELNLDSNTISISYDFKNNGIKDKKELTLNEVGTITELKEDTNLTLHLGFLNGIVLSNNLDIYVMVDNAEKVKKIFSIMESELKLQEIKGEDNNMGKSRDSSITGANNAMKTTKNLEFIGYKIKKEGLHELIKTIYKGYNEKTDNITITFKDDNKNRYAFDNIDFLSESIGILDNKKINFAQVWYHGHGKDRRDINIELNHGKDGKIDGHISGHDELWVNGVHKSIEEIVSNWERQNQIPYKYWWLIAIGTITVILVPIYFLLIGLSSSNKFLAYSFSLILWFVFSGIVILLFYLIPKIRELYPPIEFLIGPEHKKIEERRRKMIYAIVIILLIPLFISVIASIIATFFLK